MQAPVSLCHFAGSPDGFGRTIRTKPPAIDEPLQAHCDLLQVGSAVRRLFHPNGVIVFHDLVHDAPPMKLTEPVLIGALQLPCSGAVISTIYRRTRRCEIARLVALLKPVAIDNSHAPRAGKADEASASEVGEGTAYSLHRKGEIIRDVVTRREQHN